MRAALETLTEIANASGRRTVAILGEMKELGPLGEAEHERLGSEIAERKISLVIGCGGLIDLTLDQAAKAGTSVAKADSTLGAAELALEAVRAGDAVLLKGSRAAGVERIWDALAKKHGAERSAEDREEHR
jgi:UDP-N-acetylmuramoyl-tripeptide--D-alanyl-D-alanine ligase